MSNFDPCGWICSSTLESAEAIVIVAAKPCERVLGTTLKYKRTEPTCGPIPITRFGAFSK